MLYVWALEIIMPLTGAFMSGVLYAVIKVSLYDTPSAFLGNANSASNHKITKHRIINHNFFLIYCCTEDWSTEATITPMIATMAMNIGLY